MKKRYYFIFLVLLLLLANIDIRGEENESQTIQVVMDDNYPPYAFRNEQGTLQGITVDQWALFEEKTGINVEITAMDWNKAYEKMRNGEFDVIDTISYNEERENFLDYTEAYATIEVPIFFHKNITGINNIESLKGFTVAAKKGDNSIYMLNRSGINNIEVYDSAEEVVKAARNKEAVIFVLGKPPALYYMYKMGIENEFNYSTSLYTSQFFRAVSEGNTTLLKDLNNGFSLITKKEYEQIDQKWMGTSAIHSSNAWKYFLIFALIILVISSLLLVWNRTLQNKVKEKTEVLSSMIEQLQKSESRNTALLEAIPDIFFMFDKEGKILDYHTIQKGALYVLPENFLNKYLRDIFDPEQTKIFMSAINKAFTKKDIITLEYSLDLNNELHHYEARLVACDDEQVVAIVRDITENRIARDKLIEIGIHDGLTGLYNRYYFEQQLAKLKENPQLQQYVGMFDLDGLKLINDTMGHDKGDEYLIAAAKILQTSFPEPCTICRIGGDEFCILLANISEEKINDYLKAFYGAIEKYNNDKQIIPMSISHGYYYNEQKSNDIFDMVMQADNRMYREKLHRRQSMKSEVVQTMKKMLKARDFITEGHASRMEELTVMLAKEINIHEKDISDIRLLAQFHDIGKVGVPDHILFKPGRLNLEEFEVMKRHTEIGHRIAESSIDLLPIAEFILKHHEHWNGSGYPFGLKGEEIPIECRILSIVDAYDAMTNDRPYRNALSKEAAIDELKRCAGTQFDPVLVEKFCKMISV